MNKFNYNSSLKGSFLVAVPNMLDPRFSRSVIYICSHSKDGSMGIVVNKPALNISFKEIIQQLNLDNTLKKESYPNVFFGGPVELERGFILHASEINYMDSSSLIKNKIYLSSNRDILYDISKGVGPKKFLLAIGYAGWNSGQLEEEIKQNSWIELEADEDILFSQASGDKWNSSLKKIGFTDNKNIHANFSNKPGTA